MEAALADPSAWAVANESALSAAFAIASVADRLYVIRLDGAPHAAGSVIFLSPDEPLPTLTAGRGGGEVLVLRYPEAVSPLNSREE